MSLTQLAVVINGAYLIVVSQAPVSATLTLIAGVVVVALVVAEVLRAR